MEGYDDAWPRNRVTGELTIRVNRNPSGPQFNQRTYTKRIRSEFDVGGVVIQLGASDSDGVSSVLKLYCIVKYCFRSLF